MDKLFPNKKVIRLAETKNRNILRFFISRNFLIFILLFAQIFLYIAFFLWFSNFQTTYATIQVVFTFIVAIYLFNEDINENTKLTWIVLIALFPLAGSVFLLYTRTEIGLKLFSSRVGEIQKLTKNSLPQDKDVLEKATIESKESYNLYHYVNKIGCFPLTHSVGAEYFSSTNDCFQRMLQELEQAKKYIFLEYFILEEGVMWTSILRILAKKVQEGVDVRIMYDGRCEINLLPHNYPQKLKELGIKAKIFAPITPILSTYYNYRDHRKIMVIDGSTAFTGGFNIADEYIGETVKFGHWKDAGILLQGKPAMTFALMFLKMWNIDERTIDIDHFLDIEKEKTASKKQTVNKLSYILPYGDSPLDNERVGKNMYINMLYRSDQFCYMMSPYFVIDNEVESAILGAAKRGIDVRIILPGIPDKKLLYASAKKSYKTLVSAGVKIYEYTPGFIHSKVLLSDNKKALVGTVNLDYRSFYYNFECGVYLYQDNCIETIAQDFDDTFQKCRKVTLESIRKEKLFYKVAGTLLRFVAPLL